MSRWQHALFAAGLLGTSVLTTGCELVWLLADDDDDEPIPVEEWDPPDPVAPTVEIVIPSWPPVGPDGAVRVDAESPAGLASASFQFRNQVLSSFEGGVAETAIVTGLELGEGLGMLTIDVTGLDGARTTKFVDDMLVDLTPPEAFLEDTVLPASGAQLRFWIGDAWVVSGWRLSAGDAEFTDQLPPGYPPTVGTEWDFSLVSVPTSELPVGVYAADLELWDAAGNVAYAQVPITIDGQAPVAQIDAPASNATVTGLFDVTVQASDDLPGVVGIEVFAGGALAATGLGPSATVTLDAAELPLGPCLLEAFAVDAAGNRSIAAVRSVNVAEPAEEPAPG